MTKSLTSINIYSLAGAVVRTADLPEDLFAVKINTTVIHDVVRAEEAAARQGNAESKTRSDVSGGGKKPWKQKGTGRARHGSTRSPIWRKGGVVFGPHQRDYTQKVNKKTKKLALAGALTTRFIEERIIGLDAKEIKAPKTATVAQFMKAFDSTGECIKPLFLHSKTEEAFIKSVRNLRNAAHANVENMSTRKIMLSDLIIMTPAAIEAVNARQTEAAS